jgi:hypothetical protein
MEGSLAQGFNMGTMGRGGNLAVVMVSSGGKGGLW